MKRMKLETKANGDCQKIECRNRKALKRLVIAIKYKPKHLFDYISIAGKQENGPPVQQTVVKVNKLDQLYANSVSLQQ